MLDANTDGTGDRGWPGELRLPFGCLNIRQTSNGANLQLAGGNDTKPPDDKMSDEMRKRVMEQMPWLKNPNDLVPTVDPADLKALWQQQKDLAAQPREPGAVLMINRKAVACSPGADIASVVHRLGTLELANKAMGLNFPVTLDGKPTDAVFKAFATISMKGLPEVEQYPSVRSF